MNFDIFLDACRNIYGKSSSTFWGIFIKIPKCIPRVATVVDKEVCNIFNEIMSLEQMGNYKSALFPLWGFVTMNLSTFQC